MEFEISTRLGPWTVEAVSPDHMRSLADVLADPNPIHLDREAVAVLGLGNRLINQGPANFAYVMNMLHHVAPDAEIRNLHVRLLSNVFEGERVEAAGEVVSIDRDFDGSRIGCRVWLEAEGGRRALDGTATLVLTTT